MCRRRWVKMQPSTAAVPDYRGGVMEKLLPEHLKNYWQMVVRHEHTR